MVLIKDLNWFKGDIVTNCQFAANIHSFLGESDTFKGFLETNCNLKSFRYFIYVTTDKAEAFFI